MNLSLEKSIDDANDIFVYWDGKSYSISIRNKKTKAEIELSMQSVRNFWGFMFIIQGFLYDKTGKIPSESRHSQRKGAE